MFAAIYSSSDDGFTLFGLTTKQAAVLLPCQIFPGRGWPACSQPLFMSLDLGLGACIIYLLFILFLLFIYYLFIYLFILLH